MYHDPEIIALSEVFEILKGLSDSQIKRIIIWVNSKFGLNEKELESTQKILSQFKEKAIPEIGKNIHTNFFSEKKEKGEVQEKSQHISNIGTIHSDSRLTPDLMRYDSLEQVLGSSTVKTAVSKILLSAAFLQESRNLKELSSYDISSNLKKIGQHINNTSIAINSLISRRPPLLIQTGTFGDSKQSRRKFRLTEEGLRVARNYLR